VYHLEQPRVPLVTRATGWKPLEWRFCLTDNRSLCFSTEKQTPQPRHYPRSRINVPAVSSVHQVRICIAHHLTSPETGLKNANSLINVVDPYDPHKTAPRLLKSTDWSGAHYEGKVTSNVGLEFSKAGDAFHLCKAEKRDLNTKKTEKHDWSTSKYCCKTS